MNWEHIAKFRDQVTSKSGAWAIGGETTLHGYNIHQELVHKTSWMQSILLSITGRIYSSKESDFIESLFIVTGYPDPRLWCNRVAALAGSSQCTASSSISAALNSAEGKVFGGQAIFKAATFIQEAQCLRADGNELLLESLLENHLLERKTIYGFGRPLTRIEERIPPIIKKAASLNLKSGEHIQSALCIEEYFREQDKGLILNYGGYFSAWLLDLGLTPSQIYHLQLLLFYIGILPCYIEAFENEQGTFLPIACEDILYEGREGREVAE